MQAYERNCCNNLLHFQLAKSDCAMGKENELMWARVDLG